MKKFLGALLVAFSLVCLVSSFSITSSAKAVEFGEFKEYYSIDNTPVYMPHRYAKVSIGNHSKEDTNFKFQVFDRKTKKVLFEKIDFLAAGEDKEYKWFLNSSYPTNRVITDMIIYRDNENANPLFIVQGQ
ncbi:hypothetical protein ACTXHP_05465 [Bacillus stercoris]|uniref:hypothetical protein n=1 Tax=Bacillus stercoris TaxID=2054641 RepID=UPI0040463F66